MSITLVYETHATSLDNETGLASGWYDVDLSPRGEQQARELGERRRKSVLAAVYCSDLLRARRTAELAFEGTAVPIVSDPRLRECDYGTLTRRPVGEIDRLREQSVSKPFPEGESYQDVTRRVDAWLREAERMHRGATLLVVGHRATFYALEHLLNGRPLTDVVASPWAWQPGWVYRY
jgi:broad specificity phosphatase PhoE